MNTQGSYLAFGAPDFTEAEIDAVARVMRSGWVGMGQETIAFEQELSAYFDAPEVVTVNSCTSALFLSLLIEGVGPGDEVIAPSLTWCATANAALYLGATPVFCDVDPKSMCMTPDRIVEKLTARTKVVVVVHYGGYAIDVDALRAALPPHVIIVEDAAHALGSRYPDGRPVGSSKNLVCFSFYANKNLSTADGGAIALFDRHKAEHLRSLRMSGMESNAWSRYTNPSTAFGAGVEKLGYKMNFTDLQAAIGRVQLQRQREMSNHRLAVARRYQRGCADAGLSIPFQEGVFDVRHARHLLVGVFDPEFTNMDRNDLLLALRARNVGASIHYRPLHEQSLYNNTRGVCSLPVTESLATKIMTLPISAKMSFADVDYVVQQLKQLLETAKAAP
ncbi:DegT/DnrJ/EryC1/StrS family aminotransferase [Methyloversatilis sp. XJ19-13]|uniref:DegT/DnrJ/EryC1/StrS family aminotransferase n=1 Tax=Methyloversatilis sp. XJ19-13 TaxID=2963430 RepID=UPI00211B9D1D|nr:DegT/DnrJ/EryC1/StrS family aminotransferase [Methyloversatilis sp. XJ19-13]MCQ9373891.1 DegT/DnrJ/EryC1/StrS family aminotransferase [Methyloversatilis sp. XJ19-13]